MWKRLSRRQPDAEKGSSEVNAESVHHSRRSGANAEEGKKVFETVGCKGCHAIGEDQAEPWKARERDIAPNLGNVGSKMPISWIAYWVENPSRYWDGTRMPNLRLSKMEAGSVAMYLAQQKNEPKNPAKGA